MLDRADCADFGCHNSIRLETKHFLNTLALTFISFSGRFVFAMQKHYLFFFASDPLVFCFFFYKEVTYIQLQLFTCYIDFSAFYPTALKGCRGIVFTHGVRMGRQVGWPAAGNSLSGLYLRNRKV